MLFSASSEVTLISCTSLILPTNVLPLLSVPMMYFGYTHLIVSSSQMVPFVSTSYHKTSFGTLSTTRHTQLQSAYSVQKGHTSEILHVTEVFPLSPSFDPWRRTDPVPETPRPCLNAKRWIKPRKQAIRAHQTIISNGFVINFSKWRIPVYNNRAKLSISFAWRLIELLLKARQSTKQYIYGYCKCKPQPFALTWCNNLLSFEQHGPRGPENLLLNCSVG